ncbi:MAG: hypothetical protein MK081_11790 [Flavobacteriales bacterium]|nr:hypothetical protein [Flavobacteriales bacterium]
MVKLIKEIALFIVFFALAGATLMLPGFFHDGYEDAFFGSPRAGGATNLRIPEFDSLLIAEETIDYLFVGSSTCYRGIDPSVMFEDEVRAYNLCSSSQQIMNARPLVEWALNHTQVEHLVIDIHPEIWPLSGVEPARDHLRNNNLVSNETFFEMAATTGDPYTLYMWIYFSLRRHFEPLEPMHAKRDEYLGKGFVYSNNPPADSLICEEVFEDMCLGWKDLKALRSLVESIESQGGEVTLLVPPVKCLSSFELPEDLAHLKVIDGRECQIPDSLYYDENHMIGAGAHLYSAWLAKQLK